MENAKYGMQFAEIAKELGFQNGDHIVSIDGKTVETAGDFTYAMLLDKPKEVVVSREGEKFAIAIPDDFARTVLRNGSKSFCEYNFPFVIDSVVDQGPAALAGLQSGDSLVGVNEVTMFSFFDYAAYFNAHKNSEITLNLIRDDSLVSIPIMVNQDGKIGTGTKTYLNYLEVKSVEYGFFESIPHGIAFGMNKLSSYIKQFRLFKYKEGATSLGGFGTIGSIFPKTWDWLQFWTMTGFLAIALAFMNFLPIPALDGGYFLFILIEMITGRKPSDKFLGYANTVGFALLLLLLLYANGMDVYRAFLK
jgi:regulator of sigma E protease